MDFNSNYNNNGFERDNRLILYQRKSSEDNYVLLRVEWKDTKVIVSSGYQDVNDNKDVSENFATSKEFSTDIQMEELVIDKDSSSWSYENFYQVTLLVGFWKTLNIPEGRMVLFLENENLPNTYEIKYVQFHLDEMKSTDIESINLKYWQSSSESQKFLFGIQDFMLLEGGFYSPFDSEFNQCFANSNTIRTLGPDALVSCKEEYFPNYLTNECEQFFDFISLEGCTVYISAIRTSTKKSMCKKCRPGYYLYKQKCERIFFFLKLEPLLHFVKLSLCWRFVSVSPCFCLHPGSKGSEVR